MITITTVCGMGLGTSMMLAMQVRQVLESIGVQGKVHPIDLGSFKSSPSDIVVTTRAMEAQVSGTTAKVVAVDNLIDRSEIEAKVRAALAELDD
ncbi:PTS sugar transporter subunit IIB [Luethyella okanaganae]|uniref:PTS sugar transporter subunit IIB n=1 Tax=Luethyella okanaganae TaxID=69372 RepID=A0ABW1VEH0_9MICO